MKKYAVIAAGGSGQRMGNAVPKQLLEINGKAIIWHSINAFVQAFDDVSIIVVAPATHLEAVRKACADFNGIQFIEGGHTRFQSVKNGLKAITSPSIVFVHDAVRCLVTKDLLRRCYEQAIDKGSAIPSVPVNDSIRMLEGSSHKVIDRNNIRVIQTPQTFRSEILLPAFSVADEPRFTDEATVVEANGTAVHLIEGEQANIKITRPGDLLVAETLMKQFSV